MKIYTKTGDNGETSLFGGERVAKDSLRIETYGTVDELNSFIGLAITELKSDEVRVTLEKIQNQLFILGSDLATPDTEENKKLKIERVPESFYINAENEIDNFTIKLEELNNFILPGGSKAAALLHVCRTVCRRAERKAVALNKAVKISKNIVIFLNRLSDLFFVMARYENKVAGLTDIRWKKESK
jgi:cob(I)alamin adenosyltransferase